MAPKMEFTDFIGIIIVNFFRDHKNSKKMLKSLGL